MGRSLCSKLRIDPEMVAAVEKSAIVFPEAIRRIMLCYVVRRMTRVHDVPKCSLLYPRPFPLSEQGLD